MMYRKFKTKNLKLKIAMENLCNNQKLPIKFSFIIKAVNFFKEHPCIYSTSSFTENHWQKMKWR